MRNNIAFWLLGMFAIIVALLLVASRNVPISGTNPSGGSSGLAEQANSDGGVTVTVGPGDPASSGQTWDFQVGLSTHADYSSQGLTQAAEIQDNQGKVYKPLSWQGPALGGHHVSGVLQFPKPNPVPKSFQLIIRQVAGVDRTFTWQLTN